MKTLVLFLALSFTTLTIAQNTYTFNNEKIELKTEVEGDYDLLWNTFNGRYRYFIKSQNENLTELTNSKGADNKYDNAYQTTLKATTGQDASKVKLTLYSLKNFINQANASSDPNYTYASDKPKLKTRIGVFSGLTNHPFVVNPNNKSVPFFGAELEVFQDSSVPKHSGFLNIRSAGDTDDFKYSSTQIALGYRFRFINKPSFNIYGQTKFATFTTSKTTIAYQDPNNTETIIIDEVKNSGFDVPLIFGIGADYKLGKGYITLVLDSFFAAFIDNEGNFPLDLALGYKLNL